jgi:hypothetical protein
MKRGNYAGQVREEEEKKEVQDVEARSLKVAGVWRRVNLDLNPNTGPGFGLLAILLAQQGIFCDKTAMRLNLTDPTESPWSRNRDSDGGEQTLFSLAGTNSICPPQA